MCKVINTVQSLAWLRRAVRRWCSRASASVRPNKNILEAAVPAGHVAVCVGGASQRFVVRAALLNHPVFRELLRQSEEEYGFPSTPGPVALPCCDEDSFLDVLRRVSSEDRLLRSFCCRVPVVTSRDVAARPLLQGMAVEKLVW